MEIVEGDGERHKGDCVTNGISDVIVEQICPLGDDEIEIEHEEEDKVEEDQEIIQCSDDSAIVKML